MNTYLTTTTRASERELVVTRVFDGPARLVFEAWTTPALLLRWWTPPSFGITFLTCEVDARTGGSYRFVFSHPQFEQPMAFFGRYTEVQPYSRLVWTNEESGQTSVTTVTFDEVEGKTHLKLVELFPSREVLDEALESGSTGGYPEQFNQLDALLK